MVGDISAETSLFIRMEGVHPDEIEIEEYQQERGGFGQTDGANDAYETQDVKGKGKAREVVAENENGSPSGPRGCGGLMRRDSLELAASRGGVKRVERMDRRVGSRGDGRVSRLESRAEAVDGIQRTKSLKIRDPFELMVELQGRLNQEKREMAEAEKEKQKEVVVDEKGKRKATEEDYDNPASRPSKWKTSKWWHLLTKRRTKPAPPVPKIDQTKRPPPLRFRIEAFISTRILRRPAFEHHKDGVSPIWLRNAYARVEQEQIRRFSASSFPPRSPKRLRFVRFVIPNIRPEDRHYPAVHSENYRPATPHPLHETPPRVYDNFQLRRQSRVKKGEWVQMERTPLTAMCERREVREEGGRVLVDHYMFGEPVEGREEFEERVYGEGEWGEARVEAVFGI